MPSDSGTGGSRPPARDLALTAVLAAVLWWPVGFLPHLLDGLRLPLSNAWPGVAPGAEPRVMLPLGEYAVVTLGVSALVGSVLAVVVPVAVARARRGPEVARLTHVTVAYTAVVVTAAVSLVQSRSAVGPLRASSSSAGLVLGAATGALVAATVAGLGLGLLAVGPRPAVRVVAAAVPVALVPAWVGAVLVSALDLGEGGSMTPGSVGAFLLRDVTPWTGAVALALLLSSVRPWRPAGLVAWVLALLTAWVVPSLLTAATYAASYGRNLDVGSSAGLRELVEASLQVLGQSLRPDLHPLVPVVGGVVLAVPLVVVREVRRRRAGAEPAPGDPGGSDPGVGP